jgi:RHS repeat-associated protein
MSSTRTTRRRRPPLTYTYNRLGQLSTVIDATRIGGSGTRTFNYNLAGTLELQNEILSSTLYGDWRITRGYDTASGTAGRYNRLSLGPAASPTAYFDMSYGYEASTGRPNAASVFNYSYVSDSNLIQSVGYSGWNFTDTRTYDGHHDWVSSRTTVISGASVPTKDLFAYTPDTMGRTNSVAKTGELYNCFGNGTQGLTTSFGYNDRSELISEQTKVGTTATVLPGRDNGTAGSPGFTYDHLGNRKTAIHNGNTATYTLKTNGLNQYDNRTVPGYSDVAGNSSAGTITVNNNGNPPTDTAARSGQYFFDGYPLSNGTSAVYASLNINNGTTTATLPAFLTASNFTVTYDDDGNLLHDGRWDYTYDAENRLIKIEVAAAAYNAGHPRFYLTFAYDYLGRRIRKTKVDYISSSWTTTSDTKFLYDGWNLLAELDGLNSNIARRINLWGLDVSGTLQGAGGVGGLLATCDYSAAGWYLPMYDGQGNVVGMINTTTGNIDAAYEYDAFGNTVRASGSYAAINPVGYSTKYTDIETGLVYYGLRYYSPWLGRFLNRDPIEESGGLNLYGFCGNNGVNGWDYLGNDPTYSASATWVYNNIIYGRDSSHTAGLMPFVDPSKIILGVGVGGLADVAASHRYDDQGWGVEGTGPSILKWGEDHAGQPGLFGGSNSGGKVVTVDGRTVVATTKVRDDFTVIPDDTPTPVPKYVPEPSTQNWHDADPVGAQNAIFAARENAARWTQRNSTVMNLTDAQKNQLEALLFYKVVGETIANTSAALISVGTSTIEASAAKAASMPLTGETLRIALRNSPATAAEVENFAYIDNLGGAVERGWQRANAMASYLERRGYTPSEIVQIIKQGGTGFGGP